MSSSDKQDNSKRKTSSRISGGKQPDPVSARHKLRQGSSFEQQAADFYTRQGFTVRDTNWRSGHKEIDLVVERPGLIVFVEVKSTFSTKYGHPASWVDSKKRRNLTLAAQQYLITQQIADRDIRFDVITFVNNQLEHYPSAFSAEE